MTRVSGDWLTSAASQRVCSVLSDAGFQVYFVGGCVRNALLGAEVSDLDLTTDALPEQVISLAKSAGIKSIPTGIEHGTVTLISDDVPFEVTTFRRDIETDGRKAVVAFSDTVEEDAARRDFTMNALYADPSGLVHDPVGGLCDLENRTVRFIGDASDRIREDYLRILRFFRFNAWYGTDGIDRDGLAACAENVGGVDGLSKERIGQEMLKLLSAFDPAPAVSSMASVGALLRILPGADASGLGPLVHHEHALGLEAEPIRRLATLGGENVTQNLRLSKAQSRRFSDLQNDLPPAELGYRFGDLAIENLAVRAGRTLLPLNGAELAAARRGIGKAFPVSAADLMPDLEGPALGKALKELEARWIASDFRLTKDELLV